jgi:5-methylcytosine-specific restriction endonuclease McrA
MFGQYESEDKVISGVMMRRCVFCGEWKPLSTDFAHDGPERRRKDCKQCYNIRRKENRTSKKHTDFIGDMKRRGEECPELSFQEWKEAVIFFDGACAYCGATPRKGERLTKDHLVPVCEGGTTTPDNIVPACKNCNSSKNNEELKTWFMKQAFFSQERLNKIFKWRSIHRMLTSARRGGECDE